MRNVGILVLAILGFALGSYMIRPEGSIRTPAAIPKIVVESELSADEIKQQITTDILNGTLAERRSQGVALKIGAGTHCDKYDTILITLIGEGVASHGDPAELSVISPCAEWVVVPFQEIYKTAAIDGPIALADSQLKIVAKHLTDDWPPEWYVGSVVIVNSQNTEDSVRIEASDYRKAKGRSVAVYW